MVTTVCYPNVAMVSKMSDVVCTVHPYMYNLTTGNARLDVYNVRPRTGRRRCETRPRECCGVDLRLSRILVPVAADASRKAGLLGSVNDDA
jgi:hypothetical protein